MVRRNSSEWLEAPNPKTRIVKRSTSLEDFYRQNDEDCLEIADNVVFERLRKDTNLDPLTELDSRGKKGNYESNDNRFRRETQRGSTTTEDSPVEDLKYKQLVFEENDPEAKTIDFETLQRKNRPADVLEYKRFLNVSFLLFFTQRCGRNNARRKKLAFVPESTFGGRKTAEESVRAHQNQGETAPDQGDGETRRGTRGKLDGERGSVRVPATTVVRHEETAKDVFERGRGRGER